jgi:hypothetical protein
LPGIDETSSTRALPVRPVSLSDTCATPLDVAAATAEDVSMTGVGSQLDPATAIPAGMSTFPSMTVTATTPVPAMKRRALGYAASTHVGGDCADEPAGSLSDQQPGEPVAA